VTGCAASGWRGGSASAARLVRLRAQISRAGCAGRWALGNACRGSDRRVRVSRLHCAGAAEDARMRRNARACEGCPPLSRTRRPIARRPHHRMLASNCGSRSHRAYICACAGTASAQRRPARRAWRRPPPPARPRRGR
jgi:hypothetical protein